MSSLQVTFPTDPSIPAFLAEVNTLLGTAKRIADWCEANGLESDYSHQNRWDVYRVSVNCYGFLQLLLFASSRVAFERLEHFMRQSPKIPPSFDGIPCPFHYAAIFYNEKDPHWEGISRLTHLREGDILCYLPPKFTPQTITEMPKAKTGMHVGIIEKIKLARDSSLEIEVIDSTRRPHCKEDTRSEKDKGGIGRAPLRISCKEEAGHTRIFLQWGSSDIKWEKDLFFGRLKVQKSAEAPL